MLTSSLCIVLCLFSGRLSAAGIDLAVVANNLYTASSITSNLISAASMIAGIILLITAMTGYREHRQNPKFVPLDKPVVMLIIGLVLLALPYAQRINARSSYDRKNEHHHRGLMNALDIDAPLDR